MEQLTYVEPGRIEPLEAPDAEIHGPGEALVRPLAVATCDIDSMLVRGLWPGPIPMGHEGVGEITAVGDDVSGFEVGDRVVIPFQISCGACPECRRGLSAYCTAHPELQDKSGVEMKYGMGSGARNWGGFLSDSVRVPYADAMLVKLPEGVDPVAVASASDNIPDGYRTVAEPLAANPGARVLVVGGGGIALYAAGIALALGASAVDYVDRDVSRLARAEKLGARPIEGLPEKLPDAYPITVDASADPAGLQLAIRSTAVEGICTSIGIYFQPQELPLLRMYTKGITFKTGMAHARRDLPAVLELVGSGRLHPELATGVVASWGEAVEALTELSDKTVITRPA
jgi:threonine dehydrogenase-like Zn-dependent dehydrogenase